MEIMRITGDVRGLELAAAACGHRLVPMECDSLGVDTAYPAMAKTISKVGELAEELRRALEDDVLSASERKQLARVAMEAVACLEPFVRDEVPQQ